MDKLIVFVCCCLAACGSLESAGEMDGGFDGAFVDPALYCDDMRIEPDTACLRAVDCEARIEHVVAQIRLTNAAFAAEYFQDSNFSGEQHNTPCSTEQLVYVLKPMDIGVTTTVELVSQIREVSATLAGVRTLVNFVAQYPHLLPSRARVVEVRNKTTRAPVNRFGYFLADETGMISAGLTDSDTLFERRDHILLRRVPGL